MRYSVECRDLSYATWQESVGYNASLFSIGLV